MKGIDAEHFLLRVELLRERVKSFDEYPYSLPAVRNLETIEMHPAVTFIVGDNGTGKSTLLEAMAVNWGFNPEGGSINWGFSTRESHSSLHECLRLVKSFRRPRDGFFLRAESFFNLATSIEKEDEEVDGYALENPGPPILSYYGGKSLHEQSHGESFLTLLTKRLGGGGLYIFDEPEAALSPMRQMAALTRIHDLVGKGSQFIIATHSPILMAYPNAKIFLLTEEGIGEVDYTDTEYYNVTKSFLNKHEEMLRILLQDETDDS